MYLILFVLIVVLFFQVSSLKRRVASLEKSKEKTSFSSDVPAGATASKRSVPEPVADAWETQVELTKKKSDQQIPVKPQQPHKHVPPHVEETAEKTSRAQPKFTEPAESALGNALTTALNYVKDFFTTGNVVLKVGIVILFFGVAFLLKYAAQQNLISIELRLASVGLGAVALLVTGWFLSRKRPMYGLSLQGAGIGILYLTIFAAFRLYNLLPHTFSFVVMLALVILSCVLAVLQDSKSLAAFGISGGFLAPVLMSTGSGSHVMLFSYYALLNSGIVGIAWFRAWRELNLLGFFFTFGISVFWGYNYYQPMHFATTEPFLLLFFLFYVTISVLFAHRQPIQLKGFIDGPLVFGLPIVAFGMQASLVEEMQYGLALSALGMGLFYVVLATVLWNKLVEGMRMLTEAFLALGIVFGSLAIPFAFDGQMTASAWALEGAAMVWVGLRQRRLLARLFGILLQLGAAVSFLTSSHYYKIEDLPFVNQETLSGILIALGALFSSYCLTKYKENIKKWEGSFHYLLMGWGVIWWMVAGIRDIENHSYFPETFSFVLLYSVATALLLSFLSVKLKWAELRFPALGFLPLLVAAVPFWFSNNIATHFLTGWGILAWLACLSTQYLLLKLFEDEWPKAVSHWYHLVTCWVFLLIFTYDIAWAVDRLFNGAEVWSYVCWAIVPAIFVVLLIHYGEKVRWPIGKNAKSYLGHGVFTIIGYLVVWSIASVFVKGNPAPLPHILLFNPLAITQIFVFLVMFNWILKNREEAQPLYAKLPSVAMPTTLAALIFLWLNGATARFIYLYFDVPYRLDPLLSSIVFQSAVSILWSVMALSVTVWATRRGNRVIWFAGAALLSCVVIKLFMVDLSSTGTIARIVSFIAVGLLMLLIGYLSPIPPRENEKKI